MDQEQSPLENLLALLDPAPIDPAPAVPAAGDATEDDPARRHPADDAFPAFRGSPPLDGSVPLYGGLLAGQALAAAGRSVAGGRVHSLHAYFLRPGASDQPTDYRVAPLADSRSFSVREITASQRGIELCALTASFHRDEPGVSHQDPMPPVPDPEGLPTYEERLSKAFGQHIESLRKPYDLRFVGPMGLDAASDPALGSPRTQVWVRFPPLPPGSSPEQAPLLHSCLLAYVSDTVPMEAVLVRHALSIMTDVARCASLDHAVWFHRQPRADEWLLYDMDTPVAAGARALVRGRFFTRDGELTASVAQELYVRVTPEARAARTNTE